MRLGRISLFFILCLGGCFTARKLNLRAPIYLITDPSFFSGCRNHINGPAACKEERIAEVRNGANDWFRHFDEPFRPQVVIVYSHDDIPAGAENTPIHLQMKKGYCGSRRDFKIAACYHYIYHNEVRIVFESNEDITQRVITHEFGHALGREHNDTAEGIGSVMSYSLPTYVLPIDIDKLCQIHEECPAYENTWCEGEFYHAALCPSASFEEGFAKWKAREAVKKK